MSILGSSESIVLKRRRVNGRRGRKGTCGGVGRGRRRGEAWRFILYLIKAGLLPVRFQMGPEDRRPAVLDGLHHAALLRADLMGLAIGLAVFAEDVRELQPPRPRLGVGGLAHGSGASLLRPAGPCFPSGVAHRGGDVSMPQETLDTVEIDPGLQEMCGEGVAKPMDSAMLLDPGLVLGVVVALLGLARIDGTPPIA